MVLRLSGRDHQAPLYQQEADDAPHALHRSRQGQRGHRARTVRGLLSRSFLQLGVDYLTTLVGDTDSPLHPDIPCTGE